MTAFSRRLAWGERPNRLAEAESARRAAGTPIVDLTVSNPAAAGLDLPDGDLGRAFGDARIAGYEPHPLGLGSARAAVAADFARRGAGVSPDAIAVTASTSESYALLFKLLGDPGDAVLMPEPSYPLIEYLARLEGLEPRPYRMNHDGGGRWRIDFATLDWSGARAVCLVSPGNPTGAFVNEADWQRLDALAAGRDVPMIVDQVFADYPWNPPPDAVLEVASRRPRALTLCLGGLSKSCGLPQMKLGWLAALGPDAAVADALGRLELVADTYLSVGTPVQVALPRLLDIGIGIRDRIRARVADNRRRLIEAAGTGNAWTVLSAQAGWSAIVRLPPTSSDEEWALRLLSEDGVLVQPGYFFDLPMESCLVLGLIVAPSDFAAGIERLAARVGADAGGHRW